ncbi:MAG: M48 family metalloprotease [Pseudomonadota bacterium]
MKSNTATQRTAAVCALAGLTAAAGVVPAEAQRIPLIRDSEIERLLSDYAKPIFSAAGLGGGRVSIRIVRSSIFNAFVVDGRNVYIHTGALLQSQTPNQIIGVIAHEAGHIAGGHMAALRSRIQRDQTRMLLVRILGIGAAIATGNAAAAVAGDQLVLRSLLAERRSQEAAADQAGLQYLNATAQSGRGMVETFERFAQQEFISDSYKDPFVRSHPVATKRLSNLRRMVERSPYYNKKDAPGLQLRHDLMRAKLSGYLDAPRAVMNRYPRSDQSLPAIYARAIASFFRGGTQGLQRALSQIDQLIQKRPRYPYFWELKGDLLMRSGRPKEAIPFLQKARALDPNAPLIKVQLASAMLQLNDRSKIKPSIKLLRQTLLVDENPRAYRTLADAFYRQGRQAEANAAIAQAAYLGGNLKRAKTFARRAKPKLKRGSPYWVKMDDILNAGA